MEKFTLGQVIDGLLAGTFVKAWANEFDYTPKKELKIEHFELLVTEHYNEPKTEKFMPNQNDHYRDWYVEYHPSHQPLDFLTIRFIKEHGGYRETTEEHFAGKSIIDANTKIIMRNDFVSHLTSVGYLGKQVIIFKGEVKIDE